MQFTFQRFETLLNQVPAKLLVFTEEAATEKLRPGKWSKKEVMGHLIDSAANNHQRFVRLQMNDALPLLNYQQDDWVKLQHYNERLWNDIVQLWHTYNTHLLYVMRHIKSSAFEHTGIYPDGTEVSLKFVMQDYVAHMEHHLKQTGIEI